MTSQPILERSRAFIAAILALLLVVAGAVTATPAFAAGAALSAPEVPRAGGSITVTGSGYSTADPGIYLGVRAAGASSDTYTVWVNVGNAVVTEGGQPSAPMNEDGSFSVQVTVPAFSEGVSYNLYSRKAHGVQDPSQVLTQPLTYEAAPPATTTTTTLSASPAGTAVQGASVTLTATVAPAATGTVTFRNGGTDLGSSAVDAGIATLATSTLPVGASSLVAQFTPTDATAFAGSTSAAVDYSVTAAPAEPEPAPVPAVTVSKTTGIDPAGETVTVSGSGFVPNAPATNGTRQPLSGKFGGSYVVFGKFLDTWKPSAGAPSSARKVLEQKWGVLEADVAGIGGANAGGIAINPDGTFQTTLTLSKTEASELLAGNYGIYTYPGSGASYAPFETFTPVTFSEPVPVPTVTVSKTTDLDRDGETITVSGSGFVPNAPATNGTRPPLSGTFGGSYVVFGKFLDTWKPSAGAPSSARKVLVQKWGVLEADLATVGGANAGGIVIQPDGTFSVELAVAPSEANDLLAGNYGIYTYPGSGASYAPFETFTPLTFAEPAPAVPTVTVSKTTGIDPAGETVTVTGSGFVADAPATDGTRQPLSGKFGGSYVVFGKFLDTWKPSAGAPSSARKVLVQKWGVHEADLATVGGPNAGGIVIGADGTFETTLTLSRTEASELLAGTYGIYTYPGSGASYAPFETFTPVTFAEPAPVWEPAIEVFLADGTTPLGDNPVYEGDKLVVKGAGFDPAANVGGQGAPIPADLPQGTFVVFGSFADDWKPSAGNPTSSRAMNSESRQWALAESVLDQVPAQFQSTIRNAWAPIADDGSFTATVTVKAPGTPIIDGNWGVYTYPGGVGTPANPAQELSVPVAYEGVHTFSPKIEVFAADGTTPIGEASLKADDEVVVKGTGFDPTANVGGRGAPIPNTLPQGTYVVFGNFADAWKPSAGAASSARPTGQQKWALAESVLDQVPAQYQSAIRNQWAPLAADGSFTATLKLSDIAPPAAGGTYGIYTYGAGGVSNAAQELSVPLNYAPVPKITTSVTDASATGLTARIVGTQFLSVSGAYAAIIEKGGEAAVSSPDGAVVSAFWTPGSILRGMFDKTLVAPVEKLDRSKQYEVIVWRQHTVPNESTIYARADLVIDEDAWEQLFTPSIGVTVTEVSASAGATARIVGGNFDGITGAYGAIIEKGTEASVSAGGGFVAMSYWAPPAIVDGGFDKTLVAPTAKLDRTKQYEVIVWQQHTNPGADTIYARADVPFTAGDWEKLFPGTVPPVTPPVTPPTEPVAPQGAGSMKWAISSSFYNYITGSIAHGSVAVTGGATRADGLFQFGQAAGSTYNPATGIGDVSYVGAVRFTGHNGVLDVTIANPQVRISSASNATLYVTSGGSQVPFATLNTGAATRTTASGTVTYSNVPASLTAAGQSQVFGGNFTQLDPVTFTVGVAAPAPAGSTGTVASAPAATPARTIPSTPPASTGIELDAATLAALGAGEAVTVNASGFEPNEEGIQVVVYSTPTLLGEVSADASGTASWTGSLPATLADGEHTLTFQGSVDRGIRFTLARAAAASGCVVDAASLNWGFKESFRTYIEGIAAGGWELADVAYEYPEFVWTGGKGAVHAEARTGLVTYGGSIRFTGHAGALDTTLSNARIELAGATGYLVFDVSGTTQAGEPVTAAGIRFAEFALPDLEVADEGLVLDALPATLTDAGAAAFGTYAAGEALDPVSAVLPLAANCGVEPVAVTDEEPVAEAAQTDTVAAEAAGAPVWPWAIGGLVVVLGIGAIVWIVVSRRRATADGGGDSTTD